MSRHLLLLALILCPAAPAAAAGINLSWNDCGAFGAANEMSACLTNAGAHTLVGSFVAPAGIDSLNGNEIVIDFLAACPTVPDWWQFKNAGTCRQNSVSLSFDFTSGPASCLDSWAGRALGAWNYSIGFSGANRVRMKVICAIHREEAGPVPEGQETYSFKITMDDAKSVGGGSCAGCQAGMCIVLNSVRLTQNPNSVGGSTFLGNPALRNVVSWQGAEFASYTDPGPGSPELCTGGTCPTPALNRTWGALKSLYR
jgi:hypothetical protein